MNFGDFYKNFQLTSQSYFLLICMVYYTVNVCMHTAKTKTILHVLNECHVTGPV